jgi:hypothetical protein
MSENNKANNKTPINSDNKKKIIIVRKKKQATNSPPKVENIENVDNEKKNLENISLQAEIKTDFIPLKEETKDTGVIYMIENTENDKKYIGQASSYITRHGKLIRHGAEKRFKEHLHDAEKNRNFMPNFYESIRTIGKDKFTVKILEICNSECIDERESFYITKYQTNINGYNFFVGNFPGRKNNNPERINKIKETMINTWQNNEEYRKKTTEANLQAVIKRAESGQTRKEENKDLPANIYETENGYDIRIMRDNKFKITSVTGKNKTKEVLLEEAIKKRDEIMKAFEDNTIDDMDFEKKKDHNGNDLPKGIIFIKRRGRDAYEIRVKVGGKQINRYVCDSKLTLDEKLEKAKEIHQKLENSTEVPEDLKPNNKKKDAHDGSKLPDGISYLNTAQKGGIYVVKYMKDNVAKKKNFTDKKMSLDEKLRKALDFYNQHNNNNNDNDNESD